MDVTAVLEIATKYNNKHLMKLAAHFAKKILQQAIASVGIGADPTQTAIISVPSKH
jgi:hypothetical protein